MFGRNSINKFVFGHVELSGALILARMLYEIGLDLLRHCKLLLLGSDQGGLDGGGNF